MSLLAHTYALMGKRAEAKALLEQLEYEFSEKHVSGLNISEVYAGLGEKDKALKWLEKAHQQRSASLVYLKMNPNLDNLRSDPGFIAMLKEIGLE